MLDAFRQGEVGVRVQVATHGDAVDVRMGTLSKALGGLGATFFSPALPGLSNEVRPSANLGIGSRLPAHLVSLGRVLLAALPPEQRKAYLESADFKPATPRTVRDPRRLAEILSRVENDGYAWVDGELDPAICGIAVPLRDQGGRVVAAVSVSMISGTLNEAAARKKYLVPLKRIAQDIRTQMASAR